MRALIIKDKLLLGLFLLGGLVGLSAMAIDRGFDHVFVFPSTSYVRHMFYVWWPVAVGFGIVAATWDELLGTEAYLRHRPIEFSRLVGARLLGFQCGRRLAPARPSGLIQGLLRLFSLGTGAGGLRFSEQS